MTDEEPVYDQRKTVETTVLPAEHYRILYEEEYADNNLVITETRSRSCGCKYKTENGCPYGLTPHDYTAVNRSVATEVRKIKSEVELLGKPMIREHDLESSQLVIFDPMRQKKVKNKELTIFMCRGYWKAYLEH